jgi:protein-S-isoprenylcysteine O-methyltransferase Ste14
MGGAERDIPGVIAPPPLIYLGGLGIGFLLEALLPGGSFPPAVSWGLGGILLVVGAVLQGSFVTWFRRAGTPVPPYARTTALVTDGPYRLSRNPGYLGFALAYAGIALLADAPWVLLPLPFVLVVMQQGVIVREERYLERLFGQDYLDFRARTRRWL